MKLKLAAAALLCTAMPSIGDVIKMGSKSTINKDGSAKFSMVLEIDLTGPMALMGMAGGSNPLGDGKDILVTLMKVMNGQVDVWSDAKAELTKGKATRISMSGFTKDWRTMGDFKKAIAATGQAGQLPLNEFPDFKLMDMKSDSSGNTVITMAGIDDIGNILDAARKLAIKEGRQPKPGELKVDRADIEQGLKQAREQWAGLKGIASPFITGISVKSEIEVSGTITESAVFKKTSDNSATFTFSGDQILSLADQIMNDEELPGKIVTLAGTVEENFDNEKSTAAVKNFIEPYLKAVYGGAANPKIVIKDGPDAFDYAAETEKAKAAQSDGLKSLLGEVSKGGAKVKLPTAKKKEP